MGDALSELLRRQTYAENDRSLHRSAGRHIEAAACEIRVQAFREAIAVLKGKPLPPNRLMQSGGRRSAEMREDRSDGKS